MIIARYITKEIAWTFLVIVSVLLFIALSNKFALYLAKAATGDLPISLVFKVMGLYVPELLSLLLPLSLFVAILFALGRIHADSEMTVLATAGVGWGVITRIIVLFSLPIMVLIGLYTLWLAPIITEYRDQTLAEAESVAIMQSLLPGRFQRLMDEKMVFYLEDILLKEKNTGEERELQGIFIAEQPGSSSFGENYTLITAESARLEKEKDKDYLVLKNGYRYQGTPGKADYKIVQFSEYGRSLELQADANSSDIEKLKTTHDLLQSSNSQDIGELQWRVSIPLTIPILALLAIPLARVQPRQGRFAKFLPAIIIYILYYNLVAVSKRWLIAGSLSSWIGVWWVHAVVLLLSLSLLAKESGWWREFRHRFNVRLDQEVSFHHRGRSQ